MTVQTLLVVENTCDRSVNPSIVRKAEHGDDPDR
jgi:hypothetical protein